MINTTWNRFLLDRQRRRRRRRARLKQEMEQRKRAIVETYGIIDLIFEKGQR